MKKRGLLILVICLLLISLIFLSGCANCEDYEELYKNYFINYNSVFLKRLIDPLEGNPPRELAEEEEKLNYNDFKSYYNRYKNIITTKMKEFEDSKGEISIYSQYVTLDGENYPLTSTKVNNFCENEDNNLKTQCFTELMKNQKEGLIKIKENTFAQLFAISWFNGLINLYLEDLEEESDRCKITNVNEDGLSRMEILSAGIGVGAIEITNIGRIEENICKKCENKEGKRICIVKEGCSYNLYLRFKDYVNNLKIKDEDIEGMSLKSCCRKCDLVREDIDPFAIHPKKREQNPFYFSYKKGELPLLFKLSRNGCKNILEKRKEIIKGLKNKMENEENIFLKYGYYSLLRPLIKCGGEIPFKNYADCFGSETIKFLEKRDKEIFPEAYK